MIGNCLSISPQKSNHDFLQLHKQNIWFVCFEYLYENCQILEKLILMKNRMKKYEPIYVMNGFKL